MCNMYWTNMMRGYTASAILQPQNATRSGPILSVNPCVLKGPFWALFQACQLWTRISKHYEMVHLHFFFSSCRRWRWIFLNSQNSAGMHSSVTHCSLSIYICTCKCGQHKHAHYKVHRVMSNYTWVYPIYLSICMIHHDSACLNEDLLGSH